MRSRPLVLILTGLISLLEWSGKIIAFGILFFMLVTLFVNVVLRYANGSGIAWAYEIHAVLLPWLVGAGIVVAAARGRNIAISFLPDRLGIRTRRYLFIMVNSWIALICIGVIWSSQPVLKASFFQKLSTLGIRQIWGYSSLIYAFSAMTVIAAAYVLLLLLDAVSLEQNLEKQSLS